jgi:hypothetical protein
MIASMNGSNNSTLAQKYPTVASWIKEDTIEITHEFRRDIVARASDEEGVIWEGDGFGTLDEAMQALEAGIQKWIKDNF